MGFRGEFLVCAEREVSDAGVVRKRGESLGGWRCAGLWRRREGAVATVLGHPMLVSRPRLVESARAYLAAWFPNRGVLRCSVEYPITECAHHRRFRLADSWGGALAALLTAVSRTIEGGGIPTLLAPEPAPREDRTPPYSVGRFPTLNSLTSHAYHDGDDDDKDIDDCWEGHSAPISLQSPILSISLSQRALARRDERKRCRCPIPRVLKSNKAVNGCPECRVKGRKSEYDDISFR